jgi:hypothetical protein
MRDCWLAILILVGVSGCDGIHSVQYYNSHPTERAKTLQECLFNGKAGADCKAAADADASATLTKEANKERDYQAFARQQHDAAVAASAGH